MRKTSIPILIQSIIVIILTSCSTNKSMINPSTVTELDSEIFELVIHSILDDDTYSKQNTLASTFPLRNDTTVTESEWEKQINHTNIQSKRTVNLSKNDITEIALDEYHSCYFQNLVPPFNEQNEGQLPEYCNKFENKYALAVSLPEKKTTESSMEVITGIFSNFGYTIYKITLSNKDKLIITNKEKIGWVYS